MGILKDTFDHSITMTPDKFAQQLCAAFSSDLPKRDVTLDNIMRNDGGMS